MGCSGDDASSDTKVTAGAAALDPGVGVSMTDAAACTITTSAGSERSGDPAAQAIHRRWRSYLAEDHILRDIAIDAEGHPLPTSAADNGSAYVKLDAEGNTLVRAVEADGGKLLRIDVRRDRHGNALSHREVHTSLRDLDALPPETAE